MKSISFLGSDAVSLNSTFELSTGKIITAEVIETTGERVFLNVKGRVVSAKTYLLFSSGQKLNLKIIGIKDNEIILKPVPVKNKSIGKKPNQTYKQKLANLNKNSINDLLKQLEKSPKPGKQLKTLIPDLDGSDDINHLSSVLKNNMENTAALIKHLNNLDDLGFIEKFLNLHFSDEIKNIINDKFIYLTLPVKANDWWGKFQLKVKKRNKDKSKIDLNKKLRISLTVTTKNLGKLTAELLIKEKDLIGQIKVEDEDVKKLVDKYLHRFEKAVGKKYNIVSLKCKKVVQKNTFKHKLDYNSIMDFKV